jgi:acylphosphatase
MMRRAIITVKGKVQKVRYRSKVKGIAVGLGIVGEVENLEDGSVRIYAESEEEVLNEFITKLKLKNHLIDVTDVSVRFADATGEFRAFKKVLSGTMYEVAERLDEAADILENLTGAVIHGNDKIIGTIEQGNKEVISTIDRGNAMLAEKIDAGRAENREGFGSLAEKIDAGRAENRAGFGSLAEKIDAGRAENRAGFGSLGEKIAGIKEDTGEMTNTLYFLKEVHRETLELKEKYDLLSRDVAEIKIKINAG